MASQSASCAQRMRPSSQPPSTGSGGGKPESLYERYLREQEAGERVVLVADTFAGYGTIRWESTYEPFRKEGIPEVMDLNVLPEYRRRGVASALMDEAERRVAAVSPVIGIGVGMYADYGPAQRMYVTRGYVPDARGLTLDRRPLAGLETVVVDDELGRFLTRHLRPA